MGASRKWIRENPPRWDAAKARIVGGAPAGAIHLEPPAEGALVPGEWWRVEEDGETVGYGWMDIVWGDGEILLAVDGARQDGGVGTFILDQLEKEAAERGLEYVYNWVRPEHPQGAELSKWLEARGFTQTHDDGRLARRVRRG